MCVEATSVRSRRVCRTTLMIELYPSRCWLSGPVNPIGLCFSSPSPATRETSILNCWSFARKWSVVCICDKKAELTAATHRSAVVCGEHVDFSVKSTHPQKFDGDHCRIFQILSAFQARNSSSEHLSPRSKIVLCVDVLPEGEETPYRII
jgi:hypothetical protein